MAQAPGPAKPPRVAAPGEGEAGRSQEAEATTRNGRKPPRGSTSSEGGRTLWQIFWNEEEEEPVVSMMDISNMDEEEINTATSSDSMVQMRQQNGEVVLFEKRPSTGSASNQNGKIYKPKEFKEQDWEAFDVTPNTRTAGRFLLRSDSDNELILPSASSSRTQSLAVSLRWCCINCRHFTFWQQYWWVPLVIVFILVVYIVITVVIIKTLGS